MLLKDRLAIITGAARGIGRSIAEEFSGEGAVVMLCDIDEDIARKSSEDITKKTGNKTGYYNVDVSNKNQVVNVVNKIFREYGKIDILVNNAGIQKLAPLVDLEEKDWDNTLNVNLKGTFLFSQAVAKIMINQKYGKIINIASDSGIMPFENEGPYCASKSGIIGLTRVFALELRPYNITCNSICPGHVSTEMYRNFVDFSIKYKNNIRQTFDSNKTEKVADPVEIARVALFFASYLSDHVTGEHLLATGGDIMSQ